MIARESDKQAERIGTDDTGLGAANDTMLTDAPKAIYAEAGHWLRIVNAIGWTTAALLIPTAIACVGVAMTHKQHRLVLAIGSLVACCLWIAIMQLYGWSAREARLILMRLEARWNVPFELRLYTIQRRRGPGRAAVLFQMAILLFVILAWVYVFNLT